MRNTRDLGVGAALLVGLVDAGASGQSFTELESFPDPGGYLGETTAVSVDGRFIAGRSRSGGVDEAALWRCQMSPIPLGILPSNQSGESSFATGVSDDGRVIVGSSSGGGFRWTPATGMTPLARVAGGLVAPAGLTGNGEWIVGNAAVSPGARVACMWDAAGAIELLPGIPVDRTSYAFAASEDGSVVVGYCPFVAAPGETNATEEAYRWHADGTIDRLGFLALLPTDARLYSRARDVTPDGVVVVGSATDNSGHPRAFRWHPVTGMEDLGLTPEGLEARAVAISDNGRMVVGITREPDGDQAFLWTREDGMRAIRDVLLDDYGVVMPAWPITYPTDISGDGTTIVGWGLNTNGDNAAWRVSLEPVCVADVNCDGAVLPNDFSAWVVAFNALSPACDQNGDGLCTPADFSQWVVSYNAGCE